MDLKDVYYECCNLNRSCILTEEDIGEMGTVATELETILDSDSDDDTITVSDTDDESKPKTVIAGPQLVVPSRIDYDRYCWSEYRS